MSAPMGQLVRLADVRAARAVKLSSETVSLETSRPSELRLPARYAGLDLEPALRAAVAWDLAQLAPDDLRAVAAMAALALDGVR